MIKRVKFRLLVPFPIRVFLKKRILLIRGFKGRLSLAKQLRETKDQVSLIRILNQREAGLSATTLGFWFIADHFLKSYLEENTSLRVLEFGSAGEGFLSTIFFDWHAQRTPDGSVVSIDISRKPKREYKSVTKKTLFVVDDALNYIKQLNGEKFDVIYFDSMSIFFENPWPSMVHHSELFANSIHLLKDNGILVFDDTPSSLDAALSDLDRELMEKFEEINGFLPGKGALVLREIDKHRLRKVFHEYALVLKRADLLG